ncbi:MAG: hypothetical protein IJY34_00280 [Clostridia bacterium]|nr:hypothetical protein [Clostridia bacterium]
MRTKTRRKVRHGITFALIGATIAFGVLYFGFPVAQRFWQSICDFVRSFVAYIIFLFTWEDGPISPTVQEFPSNMDTVLPLTWEELQAAFVEFGERFFDGKNFLSFLWVFFEKLSLALTWISLLALPVATLFLVAYFVYRKPDKLHNVDTKPLRLFKRFMRERIKPIYKVIRAYFVGFLAKRWYYVLTLCVLWSYNLNLLTIAIEALAYIFYLLYLGGLAGLPNIIVQIAKFFCDFAVAWFFIPRIIWFFLFYKAFSVWRRRQGDKNARGKEKHDKQLLKKYPGTKLVTGKQRSKKTSILTMIKRLYERIFREDAEEGMNARKKQFPFFPWIHLEQFITHNRRRHKIFLLYHCRTVIRFIRNTYEMKDDDPRKVQRIKRLRKRYGYKFDNLLFDYETSHGMEYDDSLTIINLFDALEAYAQQFFIYSQRKTLNFSNYPIREDFSFEDHGNHPKFKGDMISLMARESHKNSQYSFITNYDAFRPGKKFNASNTLVDAVEYGIGTGEEFAKERKNRITRGAGGTKEFYATQDNDGFELDAKVRGQVSLVDNKDYWVWLFDDQREGSLGADNKDLATIFFIKGVAQEHLLIPFFELEEVFYAIFKKIYDKIEDFFSVRKGSNTLLHYLIKRICEPINKYFDRIHKRYGASRVRLKVKDGGDGEELGEEFFWLLHCEVYNGIYPSDSCKSFYNFRFARSSKGMEDFPTYASKDPTLEEKLQQNSYFVEDMTEYSGITCSRKVRAIVEEEHGGGKKPKKRS